ncbi:response regulator [Hyunsoonleella pacifica]|uniref:Response regulator n=1 Tax=Hyunsoonleella pacifica TaxID=1080224 RepID=A0A4Q9FIL8_9FLAO|nr:response regulator [Hyunsoonleella pacifica]TBN11970.1 response regulator [Hyunsoonleella pacifica]GGD07688.1 hypothetical protein GCM10011368_07050 [Hyunsoonleella pacifica]
MKRTIKVLIIEDEPLIINVYERTLLNVASKNETLSFDIQSAVNCDQAMLKLNKVGKDDGFDLIFLDMRIPKSKRGHILCGEDLGIKIKNKFKKTKVVVSTSYDDAYRIYSILQNLDPDGLLVKRDLTTPLLYEAIEKVIVEPPFYSHTVMKLFRKQSTNDFVVDNIDRKMLYELANGTKMNELPQILPLSIAALERRKRILKDIFNVHSKGDRDLLLSARERGFI